MDRFAWLNAQKWWIHSWHGCLQCTACQEDRIIFCDKIKWLFQGFASFHVNLGVRSDSDSSAQHISCPLEAAHLFFATHSTLSDPAQLALRLGLLMEESEEIQSISISDIRGREKLMLTFDSSNLFILEIVQHVTLNVYADEHCNERFRNTMSLTEVMEVLEKILLEQKQMSLIDNNARLADTNCIEQVELPAEAKDVLKYTHMILQSSLQEKEKLEMEKAWGANSRQLIQQQQMQDLATSSIRHSKQQRKCIEAALLWVEVLCAGLNL